MKKISIIGISILLLIAAISVYFSLNTPEKEIVKGENFSKSNWRNIELTDVQSM